MIEQLCSKETEKEYSQCIESTKATTLTRPWNLEEEKKNNFKKKVNLEKYKPSLKN
jgi:hypothetical protein